MQVKAKLMSAACASALAAFSGAASAQFATPDVTIFVSGASAPQNTIQAVADSLFEAAGKFVYFDSGAAGLTDDGALHRSYFGTIKAGPGVPAGLVGKTARIDNRARGGSVFGVNPVARAEAIENMEISATNCPTIISGIYRCNTPVTGTNLQVPDAGVSDVAPRFFLDPLNVEFGSTQLTPAEGAVLEVQPLQGLGMGIVATSNVPNTTVFTRSNYLKLLNGVVFDWNKINGAIPAGTGVVVCRRANGSGTQTSYNWYMNNFPCGSGVVSGASGAPNPLTMADSSGGYERFSGTAADPDIVFADPAGVTVLENSSSGNVRDCLTKAFSGGVHTFLDGEGRTVTVDFGAGGFYGMGVLSLDSYGRGGTAWSFRNLNGAGTYDVNRTTGAVTTAGPGTGVAPSKANLLSTAYDFVAEVTGQYRKVTVSGVPALSGDKLDLTKQLFNGLASASILNGVSAPAVVAANVGLPGVGGNVLGGTNVAEAKRGGSAGAGNICAPLF